MRPATSRLLRAEQFSYVVAVGFRMDKDILLHVEAELASHTC